MMRLSTAPDWGLKKLQDPLKPCSNGQNTEIRAAKRQGGERKAAQTGFNVLKRDISTACWNDWPTVTCRGKVWVPTRGAHRSPSTCVLQQGPPGMQRCSEIPLSKRYKFSVRKPHAPSFVPKASSTSRSLRAASPSQHLPSPQKS